LRKRWGVLSSLLLGKRLSNTLQKHIKLVQQIDKEKATAYKQKYQEMIELHHGYPEVLSPDGKLFTSPFYRADTTMLWASNYLTL